MSRKKFPAVRSPPPRPGPKTRSKPVGVDHLIVAPKSLSDTTVGAFTRALFTVRPALARENHARIEDPEAGHRQGRRDPGPSGRGGLYRRQRTDLPRQIQRLLLGRRLAVVGAWLGHRMVAALPEARRTQHSPASTATNCWLHIAQVRKTDSIEELDALQEEADEFLRETLECYDDGAIDENDLSAYSLVLEQFHHAVVDRRAVIGASPAKFLSEVRKRWRRPLKRTSQCAGNKAASLSRLEPDQPANQADHIGMMPPVRAPRRRRGDCRPARR